MKWHLDDTTSDGIRFLLIGAGSLLGLRLLYTGILVLIASSETGELHASIAQFNNGYLLTGADLLVTGGLGLGVRIALATIVAFVCAACGAVVGALLGKIMKRSQLRMALSMARTVLALSLLWFVYAATMVPPAATRLTAQGMVRITRPALFGELSLPWPHSTTTVAWSAVDALEARSLVSSSSPAANMQIVEALSGGERIVLLTTEADPARTQRLAQLISATYLGR